MTKVGMFVRKSVVWKTKLWVNLFLIKLTNLAENIQRLEKLFFFFFFNLRDLGQLMGFT